MSQKQPPGLVPTTTMTRCEIASTSTASWRVRGESARKAKTKPTNIFHAYVSQTWRPNSLRESEVSVILVQINFGARYVNPGTVLQQCVDDNEATFLFSFVDFLWILL